MNERPKVATHEATGAVCPFCDRPSADAALLIAGRNAFICASCIAAGQATVAGSVGKHQMRFTYELLGEHFGSLSPQQMTTSRRLFPAHMRADLQRAPDSDRLRRAAKLVGVHADAALEEVLFAGGTLNARLLGGAGPDGAQA
jgi:hypothetical protein